MQHSVMTKINRMVAVASTMIIKVGYDPETQVLVVQFKNENVYMHEDVPPIVYCWLLNATSIGKYYTTQIATVYPDKRLSSRKKKTDERSYS